jgi:hypothetical protein
MLAAAAVHAARRRRAQQGRHSMEARPVLRPPHTLHQSIRSLMITHGSLRLQPTVVRAPGLRASSEVWGARPGSGKDCVVHLLDRICVSDRQKCPTA